MKEEPYTETYKYYFHHKKLASVSAKFITLGKTRERGRERKRDLTNRIELAQIIVSPRLFLLLM